MREVSILYYTMGMDREGIANKWYNVIYYFFYFTDEVENI